MKKAVPIVILFFILSFKVSGFAADKAVIIPLMKSDPNILSENILNGVTINGVTGTVLQATGDATDDDVLSGKTYSNLGGSSTGNMPIRSGTTITPGIVQTIIPDGYHDGTTKVACDAELVSANIKAGANIFGVSGKTEVVDTTSGNAVNSELLSGKKAWVDGSELTGTMANVGIQNITPGTSNITITQGYHSGAGAVAGDVDLLAGNIKNGVDIFGTVGTLKPSSVRKTGQTPTYPANPAPTGSDGDLQKGIAWPSPRFTDNSVGTITDNLTGLIWLKNANCAASTAVWSTALSYVSELNTTGKMNTNNCSDTSNGGSHQTDWRLPNINEFQSLFAYAFYSPTLSDAAGTAKWSSGDAFTGVQSSGSYWSSTTLSSNTGFGYIASFYEGQIMGANKTAAYYVWAVRGGQ